MKHSALTNISMTLLSLFSTSVMAEGMPLSNQDKFFNNIKMLCGKAFQGEVKTDNKPSKAFANKKFVMHVRRCNDTRLEIPFHVGENASRTWVITKTDTNLTLQHDHRHEDGTSDPLTMYGGTTRSKGWPQVQSFPADVYSKNLFVDSGIPDSIGNTWQMYIYPKTFTYRMIREGREFSVEFDLTKSITPPAAPWGFQD